PKRSVPRGWSQVPRAVQAGGTNFRMMSPSVGLCGAKKAAHKAVKTSRASMKLGNRGTWRTRVRQRLVGMLSSRGWAIAIVVSPHRQDATECRQELGSARGAAIADFRVEPT